MNHDLLNLIGAIRGYAEMLHEDIALLHPALKETLPAVLSAVASTQITLELPIGSSRVIWVLATADNTAGRVSFSAGCSRAISSCSISA